MVLRNGRQPLESLNGPSGLAFDRNGNLFEADENSNNIYEFTPGGSRTTYASGLSGPCCLAFDSNGNLFETDQSSGHIFKFNTSGNRTPFASGLIVPEGLAFAPVPEPSTLVLLGISATSLLAYVWRRRSA